MINNLERLDLYCQRLRSLINRDRDDETNQVIEESLSAILTEWKILKRGDFWLKGCSSRARPGICHR